MQNSDSAVVGWGRVSAFLISAQVMLMLQTKDNT